MVFGADAAFAKPELYAALEAQNVKHPIRLPSNDSLERQLAQAVKMTRLSCRRFGAKEVRLWLSLIAYNLGNLWRRLVLPARIDTWSLAK